MKESTNKPLASFVDASIRGGLFALVVFVLSQAARAEDASFRFLATGDVPYSAEQESAFRRLLRQSAGEDFAFLMHVGDFKAQAAACSDEEFEKIRDLFRAYPKPVVYTPGDNEWTDCHGVGTDPVERLDKLRELFFKDRQTLRLAQLNAVHQRRQAQFERFVENYRFTRSGVWFIVAHVVGSGNNYRKNHPPSMEEFRQRNRANLAFLLESFAAAVADDAPGIAVVIHANPGFEQGKAPGFADFVALMRDFLAKYRRPVVCIHGDTHYFRIDKPLRDEAGQAFLHFTRMEVFGAPHVAGVVVAVDPADPQVFSFRPYYLDRISKPQSATD